jgi:hypothetical protein
MWGSNSAGMRIRSETMFKFRLCLALIAGALLFGQQSQVKFDFCGLGSHHECNCVRHTQQVRAVFIQDCDLHAKSDKERDACMKNMPAHCDVAEHYWRGDSNDNDGEDSGPMPDQCTSACKKKDCKCDDGPVCHLAHTAADHQPPKRGSKKDR